MTSARLNAYLFLERAMLELDATDDELADEVRDAMDPVWYALSYEDRQLLNNRESREMTNLFAAAQKLHEKLKKIGRGSAIRLVSVGTHDGKDAIFIQLRGPAIAGVMPITYMGFPVVTQVDGGPEKK